MITKLGISLHTLRCACVLALASALGACGGSSNNNTGSSGGNSPAEGIYTGTISYNGTSHTLIGEVDINGTAGFVEEDGSDFIVYAPAQIAVAANAFSSSYIAFAQEGVTVPAGGQTETGTMSGMLVAGPDLSGSFTGSGGDVSSYSLSFDSAATNSPAGSLTTIAGSYSISYTAANGTSYTASFTIEASGTISGTDTVGGSYCGTATVPDSSENIYDVSITVGSGSCSASDASTLSGLGTYVPSGVINDASPAHFNLILSNGSEGHYLQLIEKAAAI